MCGDVIVTVRHGAFLSALLTVAAGPPEALCSVFLERFPGRAKLETSLRIDWSAHGHGMRLVFLENLM